MQAQVPEIATFGRDRGPIDVRTRNSAKNVPFRACARRIPSATGRNCRGTAGSRACPFGAGRDSVPLPAAAPPVRAAPPCAIKTSHDMRPPTES